MKKILIIILAPIFLATCTQPDEYPSSRSTPTPIVSQSPLPTDILLPSPTPSPLFTPTPFSPVHIETRVPAPTEAISSGNANRVVELARWGDGVIGQVEFSPNGHSIVFNTSLGIYIFNPVDLIQMRFIPTDSMVLDFAISPDSKMIAVSTLDNILVLDIQNEKIIKTFDYISHALAFSPDGSILAVGTGDPWLCDQGPIHLWRVHDWDLIQTLEPKLGCTKEITFSSNGNYLAASGLVVWIWKMDEGVASLYTMSDHFDRFIKDMTFFEKNPLLPVGYRNVGGMAEVSLLRISDGSWERVLNTGTQSSDAISAVSYSPDGNFLAVSSSEGIEIWNSSSWEYIRTIAVDEQNIHSLAWSPDALNMISASSDAGLQKWDVNSGELLGSFHNFSHPIHSLAWSSDGKKLTTAIRYGGGVLIRDAGTGSLIKHLQSVSTISSLEFSPDGSILAIGLENAIVELWNTQTWELLSILEGEFGYSLTKVSFSSDGSRMAANIRGDDYTIETIMIWDTRDWSVINNIAIEGDENLLHDISLSPDGQMVAAALSVSYSPYIHIWNVDDGSLKHSFKDETLPGQKNPNNVYYESISFSLDGSTLGASSIDIFNNQNQYSVRFWRLVDGELVSMINGPTSSEKKGFTVLINHNIAWSPFNDLVSYAGADGILRLINPISGTVLAELHGHTAWIPGVAFSPDGTMIATVSLDGTVRIWGFPP